MTHDRLRYRCSTSIVTRILNVKTHDQFRREIRDYTRQMEHDHVTRRYLRRSLPVPIATRVPEDNDFRREFERLLAKVQPGFLHDLVREGRTDRLSALKKDIGTYTRYWRR